MDFPINYEDSNVRQFITKDDVGRIKMRNRRNDKFYWEVGGHRIMKMEIRNLFSDLEVLKDRFEDLKDSHA